MSVRVIGDAEVIRYMARIPGDARSEITDSVGRLALRLQRNIQQGKLTGQVLKVRTGRLRRSIAQAVIDQSGSITGVVSTNVEYARAHEYGFTGQVTVKAHLRTIREAFGKSLKAPKQITVRAHSASVRVPERSFMRTALTEMRPQIVAEMDAAVRRASAK